MFGSGITLFGALFLLPLYYQQVRGASALEAGLLLAPGRGNGTRLHRLRALVDRMKLGYRLPALTGMTLLTVATIPFVFAGSQTTDVLLGIAVAIRGFGLGLTIVPITAALYIGLPREAIPSATTGVRIFQQVGEPGHGRARRDPRAFPVVRHHLRLGAGAHPAVVCAGAAVARARPPNSLGENVNGLRRARGRRRAGRPDACDELQLAGARVLVVERREGLDTTVKAGAINAAAAEAFERRGLLRVGGGAAAAVPRRSLKPAALGLRRALRWDSGPGRPRRRGGSQPA